MQTKGVRGVVENRLACGIWHPHSPRQTRSLAIRWRL